MPSVPGSNTPIAPPLSATVCDVCKKGMISVCFATMAVEIMHQFETKLLQPVYEETIQFCEYPQPSRDLAYLTRSAMLSFALFTEMGGLTGLFNIGKSLYDRVCNHLAS